MQIFIKIFETRVDFNSRESNLLDLINRGNFDLQIWSTVRSSRAEFKQDCTMFDEKVRISGEEYWEFVARSYSDTRCWDTLAID